MKIKNLALTALFFFFANLAFSQSQVGIRFYQGFQNHAPASKYIVSAGNRVDYKVDLDAVSNSQTVGLYSQIEFGYIYVQPEILYTKFSISYDVFNYNSESNVSGKYFEHVQQIDIPVNAGIKYNGFRIGGGPIFHIAQSINSDMSDFEQVQISPKSITAGFQGGIGYDWKMIHFDIRYQRNFNSVSDHLKFSQQNLNLNSTASSLQLGIAIGLGKK